MRTGAALAERERPELLAGGHRREVFAGALAVAACDRGGGHAVHQEHHSRRGARSADLLARLDELGEPSTCPAGGLGHDEAERAALASARMDAAGTGGRGPPGRRRRYLLPRNLTDTLDQRNCR